MKSVIQGKRGGGVGGDGVGGKVRDWNGRMRSRGGEENKMERKRGSKEKLGKKRDISTC